MGITRVGIVGSGIMGAGLAEVAARAGYDVVVRSRSQATADEMRSNVDRGLAKSVERGKLDAAEHEAIIGRIEAVSELSALADCDLIIESVVEHLDTKRMLFADLDAVAKPDAILATNTSTLPVVEIAMATKRPAQVCGIHFFNPAPALKLVEIVRPITADDATIAIATEFATSCGKDAVDVADRAGFIVNALLFPYLNNAIKMLEAGTASMESIDTAMKGGCGFPMGPFALLDLVGLDTSMAILDALHAEFADPNFAPAPRLRRMVAAGQLGRKSKHGFYRY
jgi:3-hydroxybutyryl-CoA dehydrogenase